MNKKELIKENEDLKKTIKEMQEEQILILKRLGAINYLSQPKKL